MTALGDLLRRAPAFDPLMLRTIAEPYGPDALVFGPERLRHPEPEYPVMTRTCRACGVSWRGAAACWACPEED